MCGRARCTLGPDAVAVACGFTAPVRTVDADRQSYNLAPGSYMPVLRIDKQEASEPVVQAMRWGLVPSFTKKGEKPDFFRMFNARSESVDQKASFRRLLPRNRCLATVEGFYEWKKDGSKKQPHYVHFKDGRPLVLAALYDSWTDGEGNVLFTFTILTTRCSKALEWLHDRMPVILGSKDAVETWLKEQLFEDELRKVTRPYEAPDLVTIPVTPAMGKPSFDGPECVEEYKPKTGTDHDISQFFGRKKSAEASAKESVANKGYQQDLRCLAPPAENVEEEKAFVAGLEPDQDVSETVQHHHQNASSDEKPQATDKKRRKGVVVPKSKKLRPAAENEKQKQRSLSSFFGRA